MFDVKVSSRCKAYTAKAETKRLTTCGARDTITRSDAAAQALYRHRVGAKERTTTEDHWGLLPLKTAVLPRSATSIPEISC